MHRPVDEEQGRTATAEAEKITCKMQARQAVQLVAEAEGLSTSTDDVD